MKSSLLALLLFSAVLVSCKKEDPEPAPAPAPVAARSFNGITFNAQTAYFSTDGSMSAPVDSNQAKSISSKIDLTFIFNFDYIEPGFFEPKARSQTWYWDDYYKPWLSNAVETRFYSTTLTKAQFDAANTDQSKIGTYFADANIVKIAPHGIFPTGSCIGGRQSSNPESVLLEVGQVFGFKNTASGKRGLIYIRMDQSQGWPMPLSNTNTKVDIIKEK